MARVFITGSSDGLGRMAAQFLIEMVAGSWARSALLRDQLLRRGNPPLLAEFRQYFGGITCGGTGGGGTYFTISLAYSLAYLNGM